MSSLQRAKKPYRTRNSMYIRISASSVLQMLLYLDQRHTAWMSDDTLERVLAALKDRIARKLGQEASKGGKAKVDVYRGAGYQMAFFFRKTAQKHSVLLKVRLWWCSETFGRISGRTRCCCWRMRHPPVLLRHATRPMLRPLRNGCASYRSQPWLSRPK
jgi:hypothetical protein